MFCFPTQKSTIAQHFSHPFPEPGRNIFTRLRRFSDSSGEDPEPHSIKYVHIKNIKNIYTEVPAYSDTLGTWEKCHCNQIVTVTRGSLVTNQSFGTCLKCHCKRGVTVNSVTVSGEISRWPLSCVSSPRGQRRPGLGIMRPKEPIFIITPVQSKEDKLFI